MPAAQQQCGGNKFFLLSHLNCFVNFIEVSTTKQTAQPAFMRIVMVSEEAQCIGFVKYKRTDMVSWCRRGRRALISCLKQKLSK